MIEISHDLFSNVILALVGTFVFFLWMLWLTR